MALFVQVVAGLLHFIYNAIYKCSACKSRMNKHQDDYIDYG